MVPQDFVEVDSFPLSPSGKIDRRRLPAPERTLPREGEAFVAPGTPVEQLVAEIWADVLNVPQVGVNDNFFEMGGDSILAIQIAARAQQAGVQISPRHFFEHQTVRDLVAAAATTVRRAAEQTVGAGPFPLTPIQRWFFNRQMPDFQHWNQAYIFELKEPVDIECLESAIRHLLSYHDALRLRFTQEAGEWRQEYGGRPDWFRLQREDLSGVPSSEQPAAVTALAASLQAGLSPLDGRLLCAAHCDLGPARPGRLFIAIHHLAVDGVSWGVLLRDLESAYRQVQRGGPVRLPAKTTSFRQWAARLSDYAASRELQAEAAYWRGLPAARDPALVPDLPGDGPNDEASAETIVVTVTPDATDALLHRVPSAYRTQINDVLLAALALAFRRRAGVESLLLHLEGHGREVLWNDLDVSRTVGWFTSMFPVHLQVPSDAPGDALVAVRDQLQRIPNRGFGFGVLRHLSADAALATDLSRHDQPDVTFNYFGQVDQLLADSSLLAFARESVGLFHSPGARRAANIEVNALVLRGCLELQWSYSRRLHRRSTIEALASAYAGALNEVIRHCLGPDPARLTPSDFPSAGLSQESLDDLLAGLDEARA
jgi:non-ribosomal peptide synthase protein (TIGR01720 family)